MNAFDTVLDSYKRQRFYTVLLRLIKAAWALARLFLEFVAQRSPNFQAAAISRFPDHSAYYSLCSGDQL